uniref:WASH-7_N domain-containing protein n=2 Tax=Rhodnius prolixus TaxID=13249 RepID=T1I6E6_RHOPR
MDLIDSAGKQVLLSYGQFLDTVGVQIYRMKESLESFPESMVTPIKIEVMYKEHCPLYERVLTDNSLHNKVLVTFTAVYMEIVNLKDEFLHKYVHRILNYGEINGEGMSSTEVCKSACELVPVLTDIINFARRCRQVVHHVLEQTLAVQQYPWVKSQSHLS